jgi:hypothetical protein
MKLGTCRNASKVMVPSREVKVAWVYLEPEG